MKITRHMVRDYSYLTPRTPGPTRLNPGFTVAIYEFQRTIESLWSTVLGIPASPLVSSQQGSLIYAVSPLQIS